MAAKQNIFERPRAKPISYQSRMRSTISVLLLLSACESNISHDKRSHTATVVGDEILIGESLSGEQCRIRKVQEWSGAITGEVYEILCAGWEEPSGSMWRFDGIGEANLRHMLSDQDSPVWQAQRPDCGPVAEASMFDELPALIRRCTSDDGWPHLVMAAEVQRHAYIGSGVPHLAPMFEQTISELSGRTALGKRKQGGSRSKLIALAEKEIDFDGNQLTLDDINSYRKFTKLATLFNHAGDFSSAEIAHRQALQIQEHFLGMKNPALGITMASIAMNMSVLGNEEGASRLFDRAEPLVLDGARDDHPTYLAYRGLHAARYDNLEVGLKLIQESRKLRAQHFGARSPQVAYSYYLEGTALNKAGKHRAAVGQFENALRIFRQISDPMWSAFTYEQLADAHRKLGDTEIAREYAFQAINIIERLFGDGVRLARVLSELAQIERDRGHTQEAINIFRRAVDVALTDQVASRYLKTDDIAPFVDLLIVEASRTPSLLGEAVMVAQSSRDETTAKAISLMAARVANEDTAIRGTARGLQDALEERRLARLRLGQEQLKDEEERNPAYEDELNARLQAAASQAATLERRLKIEFPEYGRLVAPQRFDTAAVAKLLRPEEALILSLVTRDATYVLLIRSDGKVRAHKAALSTEELSAKVSQLRQGLDLTTGFPKFDLALSYELYRLLLEPFDADLETVQHLIFVPTGPLLSIPPSLLVRTEPSAHAEYRSAAWLIHDASVSILPSVSAFEKLRNTAKTSVAQRPFLGIGGAMFEGAPEDQRALQLAANQCREDQPMQPEALRGLSALPDTGTELELIAASFETTQTTLLLGDNATERAVRAQHLGSFGVIAFATHGLLPHELRCQSEPALALTPPAVPTETDDGLLDASEIARLELDADWVILSACNTGAPGGKLGGESLSGLEQAFFYAGARALLVSHWPVESGSSVLLTTFMLERYSEAPGEGKAEALRQAQLALLNEWNDHPAFWAAFTVVGDGGPSYGWNWVTTE